MQILLQWPIKFIKIGSNLILFVPKKSLGQNFLKDRNISKKIVKLSENLNKKIIIEIGPGLGFLTEELIKQKPKKIILIEKDKHLYDILVSKFLKHKNIEIINADALNYKFSLIKGPKSVIANLPYNISVKLIFNCLNPKNNFDELIFMIQKDVATKMNYKKNIKSNRLNVMMEMTGDYYIAFDVSNNVFYPKPKVSSSVIKIIPKNHKSFNIKKFESFTRELFQNKRKKISNLNIIKKLRNKNIMINETILDMRAEDLNIKEIKKLFNKY